MTFPRSLLAMLAAALMIISCRKEYSNEEGKLPEQLENAWEFTESGTVYKGPVDTAFIQSVGTVSTLSISGITTSDRHGEIFLQVVGESISTGTYTNPLVFIQYAEDGNVLFQSSPVENAAFTVVITEMDSTSISGTFTGTVKDASGNDHTITEGKFTSALSFGEDDPDTIETGELTVWSKALCAEGGEIEVKVGGQTAFISEGIAAEPACGAAGTAVFSLITGTYTLEAICGVDTVRFDVVVDNSCKVVEVDLQNPPEADDYLPMVDGSYWEYIDVNDVTSSHRVTADGSDVFDSKMYTRFVSNLGDTSYYRKDQNVYFEYRTLNFQEYVADPPSIEMVILYADYPVNQTWETAPEDILLSGINVKVKLVSKIQRRDFDATFNGVAYTDCIEVNTEIMFSSDGGVTYQSGNSYNTVFAKGKGIVYYYDLDRDVEWIISNISLNP